MIHTITDLEPGHTYRIRIRYMARKPVKMAVVAYAVDADPVSTVRQLRPAPWWRRRRDPWMEAELVFEPKHRIERVRIAVAGQPKTSPFYMNGDDDQPR